MDRKQKQQERADRYRELAGNAEQRSSAAYERSNAEVKHIPMGQPILVGHHSERKHRAILGRSHAAMRKSIEEQDKAEYYRRKAEAAENNNAIYSEDDDAIERLEEKIAKLEKSQQFMKDCNKIVKNKKLSDDEKVSKLMADMNLGESNAKKLLQPDFCGRIGFADYQLTNNGAVIRNAKKRLKNVKSLKSAETKEYEVNGIRVEEDPSENRFRIFFKGKPDEDVRKRLKSTGYRWSPQNGCWQCYYKRWPIDEGKKILESIQQ